MKVKVFAHKHPVLALYIKRLSFPISWPWHHCQKSIDNICVDYFWILFVTLINMSNFCQYNTIFRSDSIKWDVWFLKKGYVIAILGSLYLYLHFRVNFSVSAKNPAWILIGIALHLSARLRMIYVLTILNRLVHGQFRSPLIFLAVFIQSCTYFVKFILNYSIFLCYDK